MSYHIFFCYFVFFSFVFFFFGSNESGSVRIIVKKAKKMLQLQGSYMDVPFLGRSIGDILLLLDPFKNKWCYPERAFLFKKIIKLLTSQPGCCCFQDYMNIECENSVLRTWRAADKCHLLSWVSVCLFIEINHLDANDGWCSFLLQSNTSSRWTIYMYL